MSTASNAAEKRRLRLAHQLRSAREGLRHWENSIRAGLAALPNPGHGPASTEVESLLSTLAEARQAIDDRLRATGERETPPGPAVPVDHPACPRRRRHAPWQWLRQLCVRACQACGRSLAAAFRHARAAADQTTAAILYAAMRTLEKQIWLLDPQPARLLR